VGSCDGRRHTLGHDIRASLCIPLAVVSSLSCLYADPESLGLLWTNPLAQSLAPCLLRGSSLDPCHLARSQSRGLINFGLIRKIVGSLVGRPPECSRCRPTLQNTNAVIGKLTRIGAPDRVSKPRPRRAPRADRRRSDRSGSGIARRLARPAASRSFGDHPRLFDRCDRGLFIHPSVAAACALKRLAYKQSN